MSYHFCPEAIDVHAANDFCVQVTFADGRVTLTDMKPEISRGDIFAKMRNRHFFALAHIDDGCVSWPGGLDFAPEFFYESEDE